MQNSGQFAWEPTFSNIPAHSPSEIITHITILCNIKNQGRGQKNRYSGAKLFLFWWSLYHQLCCFMSRGLASQGLGFFIKQRQCQQLLYLLATETNISMVFKTVWYLLTLLKFLLLLNNSQSELCHSFLPRSRKQWQSEVTRHLQHLTWPSGPAHNHAPATIWAPQYLVSVRSALPAFQIQPQVGHLKK